MSKEAKISRREFLAIVSIGVLAACDSQKTSSVFYIEAGILDRNPSILLPADILNSDVTLEVLKQSETVDFIATLHDLEKAQSIHSVRATELLRRFDTSTQHSVIARWSRSEIKSLIIDGRMIGIIPYSK